MATIAGVILGIGFYMIFPNFMGKVREKMISLVKSYECS